MRILVTGGAGFIGSTLADSLLERGDQVLVLDNFATGRRDNLKPREGLQVLEGTIADRAFMEHAFRKMSPDVVVHAAASYKDPSNWEEDARTNVVGTVNVIQEAERHSVRRLIYFQTALCYGLHPLEQPITLSHPIRPEGSSYAISKTAGEHYLSLSKLDYISFRLANAYGPRNMSGPLPTFFKRLTEGKKCFVVDTRRDFVFVNDLIAVVLQAIDGHGSAGYYHISSGKDYAIRDLYEEVVRSLGFKPDAEVEVRERHADDVFSILLDPSKTDRDFRRPVPTPLSEGVSRAVRYYREFGVAEAFTHLSTNRG